jgi:secreted PhoX family phosphatase
MNTQNEFGKDAGRYVYRTHETGTGSQVSVTDLKTGTTEVLAQRADWERFDGIVWTPHGTILAAEEVSNDAVDDPDFPEAEAGLVYELFVDPKDPSELNPNDPRDNVGAKDGIAARPALGSKSHEGMRFDKQGNHYGISETAPGGIYRFVPDKKGDLSEGQLQVLRTENGQDGKGTWVNIPDAAARTNAQAAATGQGNGYSRPEDVETGESTGVDRNNGGNTLYVAITGTDDVLAVDLSSKIQPFAYFYVNNQSRPTSPTPNATAEFDSPDNLALDRRGNLAITEDPPGNTVGADIWIAKPPRGNDDDDDGGKRRQPSSEVERFASLKDCAAEPTGIYFALEGTEEYSEEIGLEELVNGESLFVNRQHSGQGTTLDQFVSIAPVDDGDDDKDDDEDNDDGDDGGGNGKGKDKKRD